VEFCRIGQQHKLAIALLQNLAIFVSCRIPQISYGFLGGEFDAS
jgi:hypothetical protein